jgi:hypothetical protein
MFSPQKRCILYDWTIHVNGDETNISSFLYGQAYKKGLTSQAANPLDFHGGSGQN